MNSDDPVGMENVNNSHLGDVETSCKTVKKGKEKAKSDGRNDKPLKKNVAHFEEDDQHVNMEVKHETESSSDEEIMKRKRKEVRTP